MERRTFTVREVAVYVAVEDRDVTRWALYTDDGLLAILDDEQQCRSIAAALNRAEPPTGGERLV
jgi:hypothetical protein